MSYPWALSFWKSGECQVIQERLDDKKKSGTLVCPQRKDLFHALSLIKSEDVRCALVFQDPYPDPAFATGVALSISAETPQKSYPPTLVNFFKEYRQDLGYPEPKNGNLEEWCKRGVLLLNAIPSCDMGKSLSHDWPEYHLLTKEIITKLSDQGRTVFCFFGGVARRFTEYVDPEEDVIEVSHPSPRASRSSKHPFFGSRIFTTINAKLVERAQEPIDWRL